MKIHSQYMARVFLIAMLAICSGCRRVKVVDSAGKFVSENPGYSLTPVPLLALEREAFYKYQQPADDMAWLKRAAEKMSKEELLDRLGRREERYLEFYKAAKEEIAEIERHLKNGAEVYWYKYEGPDYHEEGYIVINANGKILKQPVI